VHLESLDSAPVRAAQLKVAWRALGGGADAAVGAGGSDTAGDGGGGDGAAGGGGGGSGDTVGGVARRMAGAVLCGDLNFCARWAENAQVPPAVAGQVTPLYSSSVIL
jgi:hypothetical protein